MGYLLNSAGDRIGSLSFGFGKIPPAPVRSFNKTMDLEKLIKAAHKLEKDIPLDDTEKSLLMVGPSAGGWSNERANETQVSRNLPEEGIVSENVSANTAVESSTRQSVDSIVQARPTTRRPLDAVAQFRSTARRPPDPVTAQARQDLYRKAQATFESIEKNASQADVFEQQFNSGELNRSRYVESMIAIFSQLKALDLKSYSEAEMPESYSMRSMKNSLFRSLTKAIEIQSQDRSRENPNERSNIKQEVILARVENLQMLSNLIGKNKQESVVLEENASVNNVVEPSTRRLLDSVAQARQDREQKALVTFKSIEKIASQVEVLGRQFDSGELNRSRYVESMIAIFTQLKALDLKSYNEAEIPESYSITSMKNNLFRSLTKAIEIRSQERPRETRNEKFIIKRDEVIENIENLQMLSNLIGKNKQEFVKMFLEKYEDMFTVNFKGDIKNMILEVARYINITAADSENPRYRGGMKYEPLDPVNEQTLLMYMSLIGTILPTLGEINHPKKEAFIEMQSKIFGIVPRTSLATNPTALTMAASVVDVKIVASSLSAKLGYGGLDNSWRFYDNGKMYDKFSNPNRIKKSLDEFDSALRLIGLSDSQRLGYIETRLLELFVNKNDYDPDINYMEFVLSYSRGRSYPLYRYASTEIKEKISYMEKELERYIKETERDNHSRNSNELRRKALNILYAFKNERRH